MDGVFINLTCTDIELTIKDELVTIPANIELVTPVKNKILTDNFINGILSSPLTEDSVCYLHKTNWNKYKQITRSEEDLKVDVKLINPYVKYPFTKEQIEKINKISANRTRLLILTKEDAEYWSNGKFDSNPFRNYRLFTVENKNLIEYPIPKTYLNMIVENFNILSDKFTT